MPYVQTVSVTSSIYSMLAIAVDRFRCLAQPLKQKFTISEAKKMVATVWVFSFLYAALSVFGSLALSESEEQKTGNGSYNESNEYPMSAEGNGKDALETKHGEDDYDYCNIFTEEKGKCSQINQ